MPPKLLGGIFKQKNEKGITYKVFKQPVYGV